MKNILTLAVVSVLLLGFLNSVRAQDDSKKNAMMMQQIFDLLPDSMTFNQKYNEIVELIKAKQSWDSVRSLDLSASFQPIHRPIANCYYKLHFDRQDVIKNSTDPNIQDLRVQNDITEIIHLDLNQFLLALIIAFPNLDLCNMSTFPNKAILLYPAQYGQVGQVTPGSTSFPTSGTPVHPQCSTVMIGFAQKVGNKFSVNSQHYNFGDIKPPGDYTNHLLSKIYEDCAAGCK